jgi:purine-binding chemotaxis protein CheW
MNTETTHATPGEEYLLFSLGDGEFAMNIQQVQEIRSYEAPTRIAAAPDHVKGVINLRGIIVPVHDLRLKLKSGDAVYNETTSVIVANAGTGLHGFVVDHVSDVLSIDGTQKRPLPELDVGNTDYIVGLGIVDERTLALVDATKLCA